MFGKKRLLPVLFLAAAFCISAAAQDSTLKVEAEAEKAAQVELQKKLKLVAENNLKVQTALTEGINAFRNKNYDLAIEKFDEALILEPDHWGTSPVILTNKAKVLRTVGVNKYNEAARKYWNAAEEARSYFTDAVDSLNKALQIFSDTPVEIADLNRASFEQYKFNTLRELTECYRLLIITDKSRTGEAIKVFEEYILIEPDELKKEKAVRELEKLRAAK